MTPLLEEIKSLEKSKDVVWNCPSDVTKDIIPRLGLKNKSEKSSLLPLEFTNIILNYFSNQKKEIK
jgi:hypothetical protein